MKQFNLDTWLQDKNRKVMTRDGREVTIEKTDIHIHGMSHMILGKYSDIYEIWHSNGRINYTGSDCNLDLFFADEEPESIEIPFGAKDSEFIRDEYYIPEGCEARIEGNKVIIEKIHKEEELTEFEKELVNIDKIASFIKYHAQEFVYISAHSGEAKINEFKLVEAMYKAMED